MVPKSSEHTRQYINARDTANRRTGRTTRIVNDLVNDFFTNGIADCYDHHPTFEMYKHTMKVVLDRLGYEHHFETKNIKIDKNRNILVNLLIPTAMEEYKKLILLDYKA